MSRHQIWDWFMLPELHVFKSVKQMNKALKKPNTGIPYQRDNGTAATTYLFENYSNQIACIVLKKQHLKNEPMEQRYAMLAHEVTHVCNAWLEFLGQEGRPDEIMAYFNQALTLAALNQLEGSWFFKTPQA